MKTAAQLLLTPDAKIGWVEPWFDGTVVMEMRASISDCIKMQRCAVKSSKMENDLTDEQLLEEFMVVHWAVEADEKDRRMVDWLLSGAGRHWMHWQAEQGKQPTREDVAEAMEVGP